MKQAELTINRLPELEPLLHEVERQCPAEAAGFLHALDKILQPLDESRRTGKRLPPSLLTPGGLPFELNARSDSLELCYTSEPARTGAGWEAQLQAIQELAGINLAADPKLTVFLQQPRPRFGSWLSLRHSKGALAGKAYLEAGPATHDYFLQQLHEVVPKLPADFVFLPMLAGIFPDTQGISEFYGRLPAPTIPMLQQLFAICGVAAQLPIALSVLGSLSALQSSYVLARLRLGASIRVHPKHAPSLTLFVHAPQLFRDNLEARMRILSLARQLGGRLPLYEAVSAELLERPVAVPVHSVVSLKIHPKSLSCSVGYSPAALA